MRSCVNINLTWPMAIAKAMTAHTPARNLANTESKKYTMASETRLRNESKMPIEVIENAVLLLARKTTLLGIHLRDHDHRPMFL